MAVDGLNDAEEVGRGVVGCVAAVPAMEVVAEERRHAHVAGGKSGKVVCLEVGVLGVTGARRVGVADAERSEEHDTLRVGAGRSVGGDLVAGCSRRVVVIVRKAVGQERVEASDRAAIETDAVFGKANGSPVHDPRSRGVPGDCSRSMGKRARPRRRRRGGQPRWPRTQGRRRSPW